MFSGYRLLLPVIPRVLVHLRLCHDLPGRTREVIRSVRQGARRAGQVAFAADRGENLIGDVVGLSPGPCRIGEGQPQQPEQRGCGIRRSSAR